MNKEDLYDFDITGGSELFSVATGYIIGKYRNYKTMVHQYDVKTDTLIYNNNEDVYTKKENCTATIEEIIAMNGGKVISISDGVNYDYSKRELRNEILRVWDAVKRILMNGINFARCLVNLILMMAKLFINVDAINMVMKKQLVELWKTYKI